MVAGSDTIRIMPTKLAGRESLLLKQTFVLTVTIVQFQYNLICGNYKKMGQEMTISDAV